MLPILAYSTDIVAIARDIRAAFGLPCLTIQVEYKLAMQAWDGLKCAYLDELTSGIAMTDTR
jgi:hypothetical protein